jgi:hypothetical protein
MEFWPFLEFLAVMYPQAYSTDRRLVGQLVYTGKIPGVFVGVMAIAPFLTPEDRALAVRALRDVEPPSDIDGAVPLWYDYEAVAVQFQRFLDEYGLRDT